MILLLSPLSCFRHRIKRQEIEDISSAHNCYRVIIRDRKIRKTQFSDLMVNGPFGMEPAIGFSRMGNGSLVHDLRIEDGYAEMIIEDTRNQTIVDPERLKLIFVS